MACLNSLKQDIRALEASFPKNHERFQVVAASVDELTCRFIGRNGKKIEIHANITETYPSTPPVWFSDTEDPSITNIVELLTNTAGRDNHLLQQVKLLVTELCKVHSLPEPAELETIDYFQQSDVGNLPDLLQAPQQHSEEEDETDVDDDMQMEIDDDTGSSEKSKEDDLSMENHATLERLRQNQRQDYLRGSVSGSVQATDRLMKELREVGVAEMFQLTPPCAAKYSFSDLTLLKEKEGKDHILLNILFKENYPFEPPFIRVVNPMISGGYVLGGGAICMELLTRQGWSSAYTVEAIILQIAATLVKGKARIQFSGNKGWSNVSRPWIVASLSGIGRAGSWCRDGSQRWLSGGAAEVVRLTWQGDNATVTEVQRRKVCGVGLGGTRCVARHNM
ncbi:hypothetical protein HPB49_024394 [Dermacentor silvarum]|uniref:Uncharacterized protein n=1 Tax=Dermacentor silvarum TaxID=543639 RepID=A0ACB8DHB6_DERSI|nr:hypothetical protein HPB49_024394 [Dermacentor silvarum]